MIGYDSAFRFLKLFCNKDFEMIHVIATIEIADGQRDVFLNEFRSIVPAVLEEEGCIDYGPAIDSDTGIEKQTPKGINVVTVVEKWESIEALKAHLVAAHMADYRERVKDLVLGMTLHILKPA
jgi:quinol monooxygenase YgiN